MIYNSSVLLKTHPLVYFITKPLFYIGAVFFQQAVQFEMLLQLLLLLSRSFHTESAMYKY